MPSDFLLEILKLNVMNHSFGVLLVTVLFFFSAMYVWITVIEDWVCTALWVVSHLLESHQAQFAADFWHGFLDFFFIFFFLIPSFCLCCFGRAVGLLLYHYSLLIFFIVYVLCFCFVIRISSFIISYIWARKLCLLCGFMDSSKSYTLCWKYGNFPSSLVVGLDTDVFFCVTFQIKQTTMKYYGKNKKKHSNHKKDTDYHVYPNALYPWIFFFNFLKW